MKIKTLRKKKSFKTNFYKYYFYFSLAIILITFATISQLSFWDKYKYEIQKRVHLNGMSNYIHVPKISFLVLSNIFETIDHTVELNIQQQNIIKLENNRKEKLENANTPWVEVEADLFLNNELIKADVRLKGDREFHYEYKNRSSYKINLKDDYIYKSLTSFSIQKPRARNYIHEWIFHKIADELDIINLDYEFVKFKLNGQNLGLYVIEESFSNNLLEKNNRRAGPTFGLNEIFEAEDIQNFNLDPYQINYWSRTENEQVLLFAKNKLTNFFENKIEIGQVLDIEKWTDYFALCDLLMTYHGLLPKSVKFYFNPVSNLFEPIAFDGHKTPAYDPHPVLDKVNLYNHRNSFLMANSDETSALYKTNYIKWLRLFFFNNKGELDKNFYNAYQKSVAKIINKEFLNGFFDKYQKQINKYNSKIYLDDFQFDYSTYRKKGLGIYFFDKKQIYKRVDKINELNKINLDQIVFEDFGKKIFVNNKNYLNNKLNLKSIKCDKKKSININKKIKYGKYFIDKEKLNLINVKCNKIFLKNEYTNKVFYKKIHQNLYDQKYLKENGNFKDYFTLKNNKLYLVKDQIEISNNILIPNNYEVILKPNQKILILNNAFIFSKSNWIVNGKADKPVIIAGNKKNFGGGIFINSRDKNIFKNLIIKNLNGPDINNQIDRGYIITQKNEKGLNHFFYKFVEDENYKNSLNHLRILGALNFYKTSIEIDNVTFINISAEDAINIFKSDFKLKNSFFKNIGSDAIDIDYSKGEITNVFFKNITNDALDFSGSRVNVEKISSSYVGDKVISSGENSTILLKDLVGKNSYIGIANKDGSNLIAKNINFDFVEIPFASYIKKKIYNGGSMEVFDFKIENFKKDYLLTNTTSLFLNNLQKENNVSRKDILKIVYRQDKSLIK